MAVPTSRAAAAKCGFAGSREPVKMQTRCTSHRVTWFAMEIEFVGAARTVTGSKHLVHTKHATILLDCGLWQGQRRESNQKNRHLGVDPRSLDAVVLSHAHID